MSCSAFFGGRLEQSRGGDRLRFFKGREPVFRPFLSWMTS